MRIHNPILQPCILCLIMFLSLPLLGQVQLGSDILGEHINDAFGKYLSISSDGKRVASVAPNNDDNGTNAGHVRVHEYQTATSSWVQVGSDIDGLPGEGPGMFTEISGNGKRVAVLSGTGKVRIYQENNGTWTQLGNTLSGTYRYSVAISDDGKRVAVGSNQNQVAVFEEFNGFWLQVGTNIVGGGSFGYSVALSSDGKRLAVGAPDANVGPPGPGQSGGIGAGRVHVFAESGGTWSQVGAVINGSYNSNHFGYSLDISGDGKRVVAGAPYYGLPTWDGLVRVFAESGGTWTQLGGDIYGENTDDQFGWAVGISTDGKRIVGSSIDNSDNGYSAGHARVYEENGGVWTQAGNDIDGNAVNERSGHDVAISGDGQRVAVGAIPPYNSTGLVRVFGIPVNPACIEERAITSYYCSPRVALLEPIRTVHKNQVVLGISSQGVLPSGAPCTGGQATWTHFNVKLESFGGSGPMTTPVAQNFITNEPVSSLYTLPGSNLLFYNVPASAIPPMLISSIGQNIYRVRITITGVNGTIISSHSTERTISVSPNVEFLCTTPSTNPGLSRRNSMVNTTSTTANSLDQAIVVFPNPANQQITIHNIPANSKEIIVYDVLGKLVLQQDVEGTSQVIDLVNLEKGWYSILFVGTNQHQSFVKQ